MKCEQLKELLPDYWSGGLDETGKAALEAHLTGCALCQQEFEQLGSVWRKMGAIPEERPSAAMRARFEATLDAYEQGLQQARRVERRKKLDHWLAGWWPQQPAFQFGFAVAFLVAVVSQHRDSVGERSQELFAIALLYLLGFGAGFGGGFPVVNLRRHFDA